MSIGNFYATIKSSSSVMADSILIAKKWGNIEEFPQAWKKNC